MKRLLNYVFGELIRVQIDNKPLEAIWRNNIFNASSRLQRSLPRLALSEIHVENIKKCAHSTKIPLWLETTPIVWQT